MKIQKIKFISTIILMTGILLLALLVVIIKMILPFPYMINILGYITDSLLIYFLRLLIIIGFMSIFICNHILKRNMRSLLTMIVTCLIGLLCIWFSSFAYCFTDADNKYYQFNSPDKKHEIIAEEWSFLLGGGVNLYERINPFVIRKIVALGTDDGHRAMSSNDYDFSWDDNVLTFSIGTGNGYVDGAIIDMDNGHVEYHGWQEK